MRFITCIFLLTIFAGSSGVIAQRNVTRPAQDTTEQVEILNATKRLTFKTVNDTTQLTIIAGDVKLRQGGTLFYCDSCVINNSTKVFEAWGKVHINDADTVNIYSDHLRYLMGPKIAYLDGNVRLTDGKGTLTTPDLEYDMETNIGIYKHGGKVVNKKSVLTSQEGWYFADMHDIYFKKNVLLVDPAYKIVTDSMIYNTQSQTTRFISMTTITDSGGRVIRTRDGYYNQQTGKAEFGQRPTITDPKEQIDVTSNTMKQDDSTGIAIFEGNAVVVDRKNKTTLIAGIIFRNKKTEAIMAVKKPLMIIVQDNDSVFVTADTLFSARLTDLYAPKKSLGIPVAADQRAAGDSSIKNMKDSSGTEVIVNDTLSVQQEIFRETRKDSVSKSLVKSDSLSTDVLAVRTDSLEKRIGKSDSVKPADNSMVNQPVDSLESNIRKAGDILSGKTGGQPASKDSVLIKTVRGSRWVPINEKDSTNRYFEAYRNVRVFNDSMQSVCDSLFYSFRDSVFRLYQDPVVWSKENQITGDTILLFTKNKKADRVQAFENGFMVNMLHPQAFNQVKSTRIEGYFTDGNIDSVRARGSAQSIYYIQNDDSAYTGVNESKSDVMDIYFRSKELFKVVFRSSVTGTLWPIRQKSPSEMRLPNFRWLDDRRPKSKLEMYE